LDFSSIKNIIFDLGGVIINIDFQYTYEAFAKLGNTDILSIIKRFEEIQVFKRYEKGEFSDQEILNLFRMEFNTNASDEELVQAWNALLFDIPTSRVELLKSLKSTYRTFLLSNTNNIHIQEVNNILHKSSGIPNLDHLFEKIYYSYDIKMSKPDLEIYQHVLEQNNLKAEETLFIDDNKDNIIGAQAAGLHVIYVQAPDTILELLKNA
jgi:putative hydrolase of the HAD superfamily